MTETPTSTFELPGWAHRGAKVVCVALFNSEINARVIDDPCGLLRYPVPGEVYTIREVRVRYVPEFFCTMSAILLDELRNPFADFGSAAGEELSWELNGFRPLVSDTRREQQDVALFFPDAVAKEWTDTTEKTGVEA